MKKILLAVLVSLGLQTQAQILSPCDSTMSYTTGSQYQLEIAFGVGGNTPSTWSAPLYAVTYDPNGNMLAEDSCFANACTHTIFNSVPYDTLTTCVSYITSDSIGVIDTLMCCLDQYWNGQYWARMMNITSIQEIETNYILDDKIYDLMGRELKTTPKGVMYIRNRKLFINQ